MALVWAMNKESAHADYELTIFLVTSLNVEMDVAEVCVVGAV